MGRTTDTLVNFVAFFTTGYAVASRWRDRESAVRIGTAVGLVGAAVSWLGYEQPDFVDAGDDGEPIEIEI